MAYYAIHPTKYKTVVMASSEAEAEAIFRAKHESEPNPMAVIASTSFFAESDAAYEASLEAQGIEILTAKSLGLGYTHNGKFYPASQYELIAR